MARTRKRTRKAPSWEKNLSPQQKAAITRATRAVSRARSSSSKEKARARLAATFERAGAPRRSARARARAAELAAKKAKRHPPPPAPKKRRPPSPPPTKRRRKVSGKAWQAQLTPQQRAAVERSRESFEKAPPQTTPARRAEYERRKRVYAETLRRSNATEASIRTRVSIAERRRFTIRNLRDAAVGVVVDAVAYRGDWRVLNNLHANRDLHFMQFIEQVESMGYDHDTAVDFWYSPEALE